MCFPVLTLECLCSYHNWVSGTILIGLSTMQAWQISSKWKKKKNPLSISSEKLTRVSNRLQQTYHTRHSQAEGGGLHDQTRKMRETIWGCVTSACLSWWFTDRQIWRRKAGPDDFSKPKLVRSLTLNVRAWVPWKHTHTDVISSLGARAFVIFGQGAQHPGSV